MIFILDNDEKVQAVLTNNGSPNSCPYYNDALKEYIDTGAATYEFYVPSNHEIVDTIQEGGYVVRPDLDGNLRMFNIIQVEETHSTENSKYVYAEDAGLELINDIIRPVTYTNYKADQLVDALLLGQRWKRGNVDYFGMNTFAFSNYETILAGLQAAAQQIKGELSFRIEMEHGVVTGRYVDLVTQRGTVTDKRFSYSKDINSIKRTVDMTSLATALIGIGNNGITFENVTATVAANGYDKPLNQDWVGDPDALQQYGKQGKHIFGKFEYQTDDPNILLQKTWEQLQIQKNPAITYELDVALLERLAGIDHEKVRIGDTVYVIDETFSPALLLQARVFELDTCFSDPSQDKCTLGNYQIVKSNIGYQLSLVQSTLLQKQATWDQVTDALQTANDAKSTADTASQTASDAQSTASSASQTASDAQSQAQTATQTANTASDNANTALNTAQSAQSTANSANNTANSALTAANGKNTNYYGPDTPTNPIAGDTWFKPADSGGIDPLQYDGTNWVSITDIIAQTAKQFTDLWKMASSNNIDGSKIEPLTISNNQIDSGAVSEAKMNWSTHLIF